MKTRPPDWIRSTLRAVVALGVGRLLAAQASAAGLLVADGGLGGSLANQRTHGPRHDQQRHCRYRR